MNTNVRIWSRILLVSLTVASTAFATTSDDVKNKASETVDTAADYTQEQKEQFMKDMDQKITSLKKQIADMKSKAQKSKESTIADLEKKQKELEAEYSEMKGASGRAWSKMKDGISKAWAQLKTSVTEAKDELKK